MAQFAYIRGGIVISAYLINTIFWCIPVCLLALIKALPIKIHLPLINPMVTACANAWVRGNIGIHKTLHPTKLDLSAYPELSQDEWYLLICNHCSGVDILLLQELFYGKIPLLRFFLKQQLIYVPLMGIAWWALDFPFMRRYSRQFLEKNPHLKGKDLESTQRACEKFKNTPVTIVNFVEGTRFTSKKHQLQNSPFTHLLKPKAGGIAFALSAMQQRMSNLIDVSINYHGQQPTLWRYFCGKLDQVSVDIQLSNVQHLNQKDYFNNNDDKSEFQTWLNQRWNDKDNWLASQPENE